MSTFNPNIPAPTDKLSVSQGQIQQNFSKSDTSFGTDHYSFSNATSNNGFHQKVTLPDQSATPPTPVGNQGAIYGKTTAAITIPFYRRDGLAGTPEFSMLPIRAFGSFSGASAATINALNCSAARTVGQPVGVFDITMTVNCVSGTSYLVIPSIGVNSLNANRQVFYNIVSATVFQVAFRNSAGTLLNPDKFSVIVLQV